MKFIMPVHLAIETNFLLGMAKGQDLRAIELLEIPRAHLTIVLPSGCIMEAWVAYEKYQAELNQFTRKVDEQIAQIRRNTNSKATDDLVASLEESLELHYKYNDEEDRNFRAVLESIGQRVELLSSTDAVAESLNRQHIKMQRDSAIFAEILTYSRQNPDTQVVLLTGNSNDFFIPAKNEGLRYFSKTEDFLGWYNSQQAAV